MSKFILFPAVKESRPNTTLEKALWIKTKMFIKFPFTCIFTKFSVRFFFLLFCTLRCKVQRHSHTQVSHGHPDVRGAQRPGAWVLARAWAHSAPPSAGVCNSSRRPFHRHVEQCVGPLRRPSLNVDRRLRSSRRGTSFSKHTTPKPASPSLSHSAF